MQENNFLLFKKFKNTESAQLCGVNQRVKTHKPSNLQLCIWFNCKIFNDIDKMKNSKKLYCSVWIEIKNWIEFKWLPYTTTTNTPLPACLANSNWNCKCRQNVCVCVTVCVCVCVFVCVCVCMCVGVWPGYNRFVRGAAQIREHTHTHTQYTHTHAHTHTHTHIDTHLGAGYLNERQAHP